MADATITITTAANVELAHLHYPSATRSSYPLDPRQPTTAPIMMNGVHHVSLTASHQPPGERVVVKFATANNSDSKYRYVDKDGNLSHMVPFTVVEGEVL